MDKKVELRSTGQPRAAVPTWSTTNKHPQISVATNCHPRYFVGGLLVFVVLEECVFAADEDEDEDEDEDHDF